MLMLTAAGCATGASDSAIVAVLDRPMAAHAAALAGDDVLLMRRTGRDLIATYDAAARR